MKKLIGFICILSMVLSVQAQQTWQTARKLSNGQWPSADTVASGGDFYYRFEVQGESCLELSFTAWNLTSFIDLNFYRLKADSTLETIWMSGGSSSARIFKENAGDTSHYHFTRFSDGTYFIKVHGSNSAARFRLRYDWNAGLFPNDAEPDDSLGQAIRLTLQDTASGHLGYKRPDGTEDREDWYRVSVPADGSLYVYIDRIRMPYESWYGRTQLEGRPFFLSDTGFVENPVKESFRYRNDLSNDTLDVYVLRCAGKGTYAFPMRLCYGVSYAFYRFRFAFDSSLVANDAEPNGDAGHTLSVEFGKTYTGHLGFAQADGSVDKADWYTFTTPEEGKVRAQVRRYDSYGEGKNFDIEFSNLYADTSLGAYTYFQRTYEDGGDTIGNYYRSRFPKGSYYFSISPRYGYAFGDYAVTFWFDSCTVANDAEPDDSWQQAIAVKAGDTMSGHLGYCDIHGVEDKHDWYRIDVPRNGSVHLYLKVMPQGETGYSTDDWFRIIPKVHVNDDSVITPVRSFRGDIVERVGTDTFSHVIAAELGKGTYYLDLNRDGGYGWYQFYYETRPAPTAAFDFVQQVEENGRVTVSFINRSSEDATDFLWNFGVSSYYDSRQPNPVHSYWTPGVYAVRLIAMNAEGNDTLYRNVEISGLQRVESPRAGQGKVTLQFYAGGMHAGDRFLLLRDSLEIEGTDARLIGAGCMEVKFDLSHAPVGMYTAAVRAGNGSEMCLENAFTLEKRIDPEIYIDLLGLEKMLLNRWQNYTAVIGNKGNVDAYYQTLWIVTPDDSLCRVDMKNIEYQLPEDNDLQWLKDIPAYLAFDSVETGGGPVRVYPLLLPVIPAHSEIRVDFRIQSNSDRQISIFTTEPFRDEDQQKDYDSYGDCVASSIGKFVKDKGAGFLLDQIPGAGCVKDAITNTYDISEANANGKLTAGSLAWSVATTAWSCAKDFCGPLKAYKMTCSIVDFVIDAANCYNDDKECQKYKNKNRKKKNVRAVSSMDPNEMIGPSGFGEDHNVRLQDFNYTILFENKATATAPAQEVVITDTLDRNVYELSSISFRNFSIGDSIYTLQQSGFGFVRELNWDSVTVRVSGLLDTATGIVRWQFITLDPQTMDLPLNPDAGFLPPNRLAPEGEGSVSFSIALKPSVKDGDLIENRASIVFDANEAIETNTYRNRIDEECPSSTILSVEEGTEKGTYTLHFSGTDKGSGVYFYTLYRAVNDGEKEMVSSHIEADTFRLELNPDSVYRFYLQATDSLYLQEEAKDAPDYVLSSDGISEAGRDAASADALRMVLQPNPARQSTQLVFHNARGGNARVEVCDMLGVKVLEYVFGWMEKGSHTQQLDLSGLPAGIYALRLQCGSEVRVQKLSVQK